MIIVQVLTICIVIVVAMIVAREIKNSENIY